MQISGKTHQNVFKGDKYARDVVSGKIVACKYVIGSCKRYLADIDRDDLYFDIDWAEKFMVYFQRFEHVIGEWETDNLLLEPWQCFFYMCTEGFYYKANDKRKYKQAHLEVGRGNGKSALCSISGLIYLRLVPTVKGNKVYSAATKKEQARIVLDSARQMAIKNKSYVKKNRIKVLAHKIVHDESGSSFEALSSDSKSLDGLQPVLCIIDELHAHKNREVYDVIDSAMSKRRDSLLLIITTAGFSLEGIGYSQSCYAKKVASGEIDDESFFPLVFTLDEGDDWLDENVWLKSNPNMGVSVDPDSFRSKALKAKENPQDEVNFLVKHLNVWQNSASRYFSVDKWGKHGNPKLKFSSMNGQKCFVGVDLASKIDLTSFCYVFKEGKKYKFLWDNFCPDETVMKSKNVNYIKWSDSKQIIKTPGAAINYDLLEDTLEQRSKQFSIISCGFDPWNAAEFEQQMTKKRLNMVEFRMSVANLSEAMKRLEALIREGNVEHNGDELVNWCLSNVVAKIDHNENVFPRKEHPDMKIDPIISMLMGLAFWIQEEQNESCYESRGLRVL